MSEISPSLAGDAANKYEEHRNLAWQEIIDERRLHKSKEFLMDAKRAKLTGLFNQRAIDPLSTAAFQRKAEEEIETRQKDLDEAKQATKAQLEESAEWASQNLDQLTEIARQEAEAAGKQINLGE